MTGTTNNRHFKRGSGVFACRSCGQQTRDTTGDNGQLRLCALCLAKSECGNALSDAGHPDGWAVFDGCQTPDECQRLLTDELAKLAK